MTHANSSPGLLAMAVLTAITAFGQGKPDFTGTWELTTIERDGKKFPPGSTFKETQIWVHQEPKLSIKIMTWNEGAYVTLELSFTTDGKTGMVGHRTRPDGTKAPVKGSAHWDGNRLIYEHELIDAANGSLRRIVRTCTLDANGSRIVADTVYWIAGSDERKEAKWYWEKKMRTAKL